MEVIPLITYPNQELQIILENQDCTIKVYERSRYTFMDLSVGDSYIRRGQLCVPYAPILSEPCNFTGNFYVVDVKPQNIRDGTADGSCCTLPRQRLRNLTHTNTGSQRKSSQKQ